MLYRTIDAERRRVLPQLHEVWKQRELTMLFVRRHIASRFRQMALGGLWAVLEPLAQLLLMSVVFGYLLRVETHGYPYAVYLFAAMIPWQHFGRTTMAVAGSLQENMTLISKVYFQRLILPVSAAIRELIDTSIQLAILLFVTAAFGYLPSPWVVIGAPVVLIFTSVAGAGLGLCAATVIVRYRDVRPALSILLQGGMYVSPVLYAASVVPERFQFFYQLNPMYWSIEAFRWLLLNQPLAPNAALLIALALVAALTVSGLIVFADNERRTVDVL